MKLSIREALESTATRDTTRKQFTKNSVLPSQLDIQRHRDVLVRFLSEVSSNGDEDMTVSELIMHLEDWP